jgi:hypothetical protein
VRVMTTGVHRLIVLRTKTFVDWFMFLNFRFFHKQTVNINSEADNWTFSLV